MLPYRWSNDFNCLQLYKKLDRWQNEQNYINFVHCRAFFNLFPNLLLSTLCFIIQSKWRVYFMYSKGNENNPFPSPVCQRVQNRTYSNHGQTFLICSTRLRQPRDFCILANSTARAHWSGVKLPWIFGIWPHSTENS